MTTPAARNAHGGENRSYVIPTSSGPVRRPSAASDCAAPSIAPCSVGSANTEISPVAAGETTLFPNASTIVQAYSAAAASRYGTTATATAMANVPAITSARPPTRRDSLAKRYPCTTAAVIPTTVKNQPSSFSGYTVALPLYAAVRFGWREKELGWFFTVVGITAAVVQGDLLAQLSRRVGDPALVLA